MTAWLDALVAAERDAQPAGLVTVLAAKGSTPREAGAKMVVSADGLAGTIGGGNLEHQCEAAARGLLATGARRPLHPGFPPRSRPRPMLRRPRDGAVRGAASRQTADRLVRRRSCRQGIDQ